MEHADVVEKVKDHEKRIVKLEINDATMGEKISGLTDSVKDLVWWLKAVVVGFIGTGVGFFIWYIQSL
jgi:hypothetical protein